MCYNTAQSVWNITNINTTNSTTNVVSLKMIATVSLFFKHSDFYEISCDVSLKPSMLINEIKK